MAKSSTYQRLKQADAQVTRSKSTPTTPARSPRSTLERLKAFGAQAKAIGAPAARPVTKAAALSPYEQAVLDEIAANQQVVASQEALGAAYDAQALAMSRRATAKIQALNGGQADLVGEIDDKYWRELMGGDTPPTGKAARNFGFGG